MKWGAGLICGALLLASGIPSARADEALADSVYLRNGGLYRGRITEIVPDDHVSLVVGGETKRVAWSEIDRIVTNDAEPEVTPPPVQTKPARDLTLPPEPPPPELRWRPNTPLLVTGTIMFAAGYGPPLVAGLPSTVGLVGRAFILVLTLGLPCLDHSSGYLCRGQHGGVQLLIPVFGPAFFASTHPRDTLLNERGWELSDVEKGLLYASTGLQAVGIAVVITSLVAGKEQPVTRKKSDTPSWYVAPLDAPSSVGLTFGVHRW